MLAATRGFCNDAVGGSDADDCLYLMSRYKHVDQADCLLRPEPHQQVPASGTDATNQGGEESTFQDAELALDTPAALEQPEEQVADAIKSESSHLTTEQTQVTSFLHVSTSSEQCSAHRVLKHLNLALLQRRAHSLEIHAFKSPCFLTYHDVDVTS